MNRFLVIKIKGKGRSLESVVKCARQMLVEPGGEKGFEAEIVTRSKAILRWFEKVVTERKAEDDPFGGATYSEVKIITFALLLSATMETIIIIDPPLGKYRLLKVLRTLFPDENFVFPVIQVRKTLDALLRSEKAGIVAIETDFVVVQSNVSTALTVRGCGDLLKYLAENNAEHTRTFKAAQVEMQTVSGGATRVTIGSNGLVKFADDVSYEDIESITGDIVFSQ